MITWLTNDEWKNYIENLAELGTYVSHKVINKKINHSKDALHFSDAVIKVNVKEDHKSTPTALYFNNTGMVKVQGDTYTLLCDNAEYDFYWFHPHLINANFEFTSMMLERFGQSYLKKRVIHCNDEICECLKDRKLYTDNAEIVYMLLKKIRNEKDFYSSFNISKEKYIYPTFKSYPDLKIKTDKNNQSLKTKQQKYLERLQLFYPNMKKITQASLPPYMAESLEHSLEKNLRETKEELDYEDEYIYLQKAMLVYLVDEYERIQEFKREQNNTPEKE